MKIREIETVCFVGAGTMGCFNSLLAAAAGYQAVIYDVSQQALDVTPASLSEMASFLVSQGFFTAEDVTQTIANIRCEAKLLEAVKDAQLVSESVSERLDIKRQVHRELDSICDSNTIITTNTSSLLVSELEDVFLNGDRFAALHSHLGSTLFDIVGGSRTTAKTIDVLQRYVESVNGVPLVLKKENPGYVLNAMIGPLLTAAKILVIDGYASHQDVDRAWMSQQNSVIGPFGLMDLFGINVVFDSWQKPKPKVAPLQGKIIGFITPYVTANTLGAKSSQGFYSYPNPQYAEGAFLSVDTDLSFAYRVLLGSLIESAIAIAEKGVAEPKEIDDAWRLSFSLACGPFKLLEQMGRDWFVDVHSELVELGLSSEDYAKPVMAFLSD